MIEFLTSIFGPLQKGDLLVFGALFVIYSFVLFILAQVFLRLFAHLANRTETDLDDRILAKVQRPVLLLALLTAGLFALDYSFPKMFVMGIPVINLYNVLILLVIAVMANRVVQEVISWYGREVVAKTGSKLDDEMFPFLRNIFKVIIYLTFAVLILSSIGIEIAPLLAGLGIAGLAVGLALQDTLSNFFAGIHILTDKPFKEGDFINVDNASSGTVENIGWRSTKVRTSDNNYVIIPNARLAQSIVTNYYAPDEKSQIVGEIGVSYDSDVDLVEQVVYDTLKSVQDTNEWFSKYDEPWVRLEKFGDFSLVFKYGFFATRYDKRFEILRQFNKELFKSFKQRNINIPYPVVTVLGSGNVQPQTIRSPQFFSPEPQPFEPAPSSGNAKPVFESHSPPAESKMDFEIVNEPAEKVEIVNEPVDAEKIESETPAKVSEPSEPAVQPVAEEKFVDEESLEEKAVEEKAAETPQSAVSRLLSEIKGPKLPEFRDEEQLEADDAKVNDAIEETFSGKKNERKAVTKEKKREDRENDKQSKSASARKMKFLHDLRKKMEEDFE